MSSISEWADREVQIACQRINPDYQKEEFEYGCACCQSALKAFESVVSDGHSGASVQYTRWILNRLLQCKPLTPIEDTPDVWNKHEDFPTRDGSEVYQCNRMFSLWKHVLPDGTVYYVDNDAYIGVDENDPVVTFHSYLVSKIGREMMPVTLPYWPNDRPLYIFISEFLFDKANGDFDTVHIHRAKTSDGTLIPIDRYFKEGPDDWEEIDREEFEFRKKNDKREKEGTDDGHHQNL